jgi:hypothetical protein
MAATDKAEICRLLQSGAVHPRGSTKSGGGVAWPLNLEPHKTTMTARSLDLEPDGAEVTSLAAPHTTGCGRRCGHLGARERGIEV